MTIDHVLNLTVGDLITLDRERIRRERERDGLRVVGGKATQRGVMALCRQSQDGPDAA